MDDTAPQPPTHEVIEAMLAADVNPSAIVLWLWLASVVGRVGEPIDLRASQVAGRLSRKCLETVGRAAKELDRRGFARLESKTGRNGFTRVTLLCPPNSAHAQSLADGDAETPEAAQSLADGDAETPEAAQSLVCERWEPANAHVAPDFFATPTMRALCAKLADNSRERPNSAQNSTTNRQSLEEPFPNGSSKDGHTNTPPGGRPADGRPPADGPTDGQAHPVLAEAKRLYSAIGDGSLDRWIALSIAVQLAERPNLERAVDAMIADACADGVFDRPRKRFAAAGLEWLTIPRLKGRLRKLGVEWQPRWAGNRTRGTV